MQTPRHGWPLHLKPQTTPETAAAAATSYPRAVAAPRAPPTKGHCLEGLAHTHPPSQGCGIALPDTQRPTPSPRATRGGRRGHLAATPRPPHTHTPCPGAPYQSAAPLLGALRAPVRVLAASLMLTVKGCMATRGAPQRRGPARPRSQEAPQPPPVRPARLRRHPAAAERPFRGCRCEASGSQSSAEIPNLSLAPSRRLCSG